MPPQAANPSLSRERLGFTLFMSSCVHAVLIIGLGVPVEPRDAEEAYSPVLDITLTPLQPAPASSPPGEQGALLPAAPTRTAQDSPTDDEHRTRLANLQAQLETSREAYAARPRRQSLSAASQPDRAEAAYLDAWRERIEQVGNQHYPAAAREAGLYGTLRMLVSVQADGSISELRILRSSGQPLLDEAALRIVHLAAPFAPFPDALRADVDILDIVRTWQFQQGITRLD